MVIGRVNHLLAFRWLSPSPVNTSTWVALIVSSLSRLMIIALTSVKDAEMASLMNNPDAFKLYDVAVK